MTTLPVQDLLARPAFRRGCDLLAATDADTLDLQASISSIAAPTGAEDRRATFVAERMRDAGLADVTRDAVGNVIGRWGPEDGGAVVLAAHLDTVFGPDIDVAVRRDGARLAGPGISDNARGLAGLLVLARAMVHAEWDTSHAILFASTVGEEGAGDLKGAKHLLGPGGVRAAAVVALDGAGAERVVHRALGSRRFRATFRGPGGHSWAAYGVANAAQAAGAFAAGVGGLAVSTPGTSCSVVRLQGGTGLNSIPQTAWAEVDVRSEDRRSLDTIEHSVRALARGACEAENRRRTAGTSALQSTVDIIGDRPPGMTPASDPLVQAALAATRAVGREPQLAVASTDANVAIARGIPAVALGAGGAAGNTHLATEWYDNTDGVLGLTRALLVVAATAGLR